MPKGTKCPKKKFVVFYVIIHKIKREKMLKEYLGFYLVIFYSLKSKLIIISQCFFVKWTDNTPKRYLVQAWIFWALGWLGLLYIRPHAGQDFLSGRFFPSIKYNYIFVKCLWNFFQLSARPQIWPEIS